MEEKGKEWTRVPKESKAGFGETQDIVDLAAAAIAKRRQKQKELTNQNVILFINQIKSN